MNSNLTDLTTVETVLEALDRHEFASRTIINMVPSENSMSALAKLPMLLDVYHRYFFNVNHSPKDWNFRGSQDVAALETEITIPLLREFTKARYVNLRPLSGLSAMALVLSALGKGNGSKVMTVSPAQGGHYATAPLATRLGLSSCYMTGPDAHTIDYERLAETLQCERPGLIYVDQSNCLFPLEIGRLVEVVRRVSPKTLIHADCSHWLGLIFGNQLSNPLSVGADSFGGSTHKSFPGPQKAIFATSREDLWQRIGQAQYEMISSHHFAAAISLGIALLEFRDCGGPQYARCLMANTRELGYHLQQSGLHVVAAERGFSAGHQLWIRPALGGIEASDASDRLYEAGIRVNALPDLPGIPEPALRIGINEATYHGLQPNDMKELADIFVSALFQKSPAQELRKRVAILRARYWQPYSFPAHEPRLFSRVLGLLSRIMLPGELDENDIRLCCDIMTKRIL